MTGLASWTEAVGGSASRRTQATETTLLDHWLLIERLYSGPQSEVFVARPAKSTSATSADYALKLLRMPLTADASRVRRFQREAILGRQISHPHLISTLVAHVDGEPYYFVMPRLVGCTIRQALDTSGPFSIPQALWMARQIAEALAAMHQQGWMHGDIQPSNVHITANGHATLLDLGLATHVGRPQPASEKWLIGTLGYVAPEQFTSRTANTVASDVYSLGVLLYEMICGRRPFMSDDPSRTTESHLREVPPSIRSFAKNAPRALAQCLARMLSKDPSRRPAANGELQSILTRLEIETFGLRTIELADDPRDPVLVAEPDVAEIPRSMMPNRHGAVS